MFSTVDWKLVSKAFVDEDDAEEWEEITLESSSEEETAGQVVMYSYWRVCGFVTYASTRH